MTQAAADDYGQSVRLDLKLEGEAPISLSCPAHLVSNLVEAITQAAALAERMRKAQPGDKIDIETPHYATGVRTGLGTDGSTVALSFTTTRGFPVMIAMSPAIASRTIESLSGEMAKIGKPQPKLS